jgi:hypothetical protein
METIMYPLHISDIAFKSHLKPIAAMFAQFHRCVAIFGQVFHHILLTNIGSYKKACWLTLGFTGMLSRVLPITRSYEWKL